MRITAEPRGGQRFKTTQIAKHNCSNNNAQCKKKKSEVKIFCIIAHRTVKPHRERLTCTARVDMGLLPLQSPPSIITQSFLIGQIELSRGHLFIDHIIMKWRECLVFFYQRASRKNPDFYQELLK